MGRLWTTDARTTECEDRAVFYFPSNHLTEHNDEIQGLGFGFCRLKELCDGFDHGLHGRIVLNVKHGELSQLIRLHSGDVLVVFTPQRCLPLHVGDVVRDGGGHHLQAVKLHVHVENLAKLDQQGLPLAEDLEQGRARPGGIKLIAS